MKPYLYCDDDCRHEGMTKEQILTAIQQAIETGYVSDPDGAVISRLREINKGGAARVWVGTEAEYNALSPAPAAQKLAVRMGADGVLYICTDDSTLGDYDNHANNKENPHDVTLEQVVSGKTKNEVCESIGAVKKSGDTMTGALGLVNGSYVIGDAWTSYGFRDASGNLRATMMLSDVNRWHVNHQETGAKYAERYMLPAIATGLTADVWYTILTSKSPVTIQQGGHGGKTAAEARNNLEITPANIGAAPTKHTHTISDVGIIYSETEPEYVEGRIWLKPVK